MGNTPYFCFDNSTILGAIVKARFAAHLWQIARRHTFLLAFAWMIGDLKARTSRTKVRQREIGVYNNIVGPEHVRLFSNEYTTSLTQFKFDTMIVIL